MKPIKRLAERRVRSQINPEQTFLTSVELLLASGFRGEWSRLAAISYTLLRNWNSSKDGRERRLTYSDLGELSHVRYNWIGPSFHHGLIVVSGSTRMLIIQHYGETWSPSI